MYKVIEGHLDGAGLKIGIVVSRFNDFITGRLLEGAIDGLVRHGVKDEEITVVKVPGAMEIAFGLRHLLSRSDLSAVIALGAVIRGDTPHFEQVCAMVARGVGQLSISSTIPVINGVLTTDTVDQAIERAGTKGGNKGFAAAQAAVEMARLARAFGG